MIKGSDQVSKCMRKKCPTETDNFEKEASDLTSPDKKRLMQKFVVISQQLHEGKISPSQAATQKRLLRAAANQKPAVQKYRQCMEQRCEDAMYVMANGTIAFIEEAIEQRRVGRQPITQHKKILAFLIEAVRDHRVTPQLISEALSELPP